MRQNELIVRLRSLQYDLEKITKEFGLVEGDYHCETVSEALYTILNIDK